jgi:hypothetical protein
MGEILKEEIWLIQELTEDLESQDGQVWKDGRTGLNPNSLETQPQSLLATHGEAPTQSRLKLGSPGFSRAKKMSLCPSLGLTGGANPDRVPCLGSSCWAYQRWHGSQSHLDLPNPLCHQGSGDSGRLLSCCSVSLAKCELILKDKGQNMWV